MAEQHSPQNMREALSAIVEGKIVKRNKHELSYEGNDLSGVFIEELKRLNYHPTSVKDVRVEPGERVPAFFVNNKTAYFGWVFWEQFTSWKLRKLWGSIMKNALGDWEIQIPVSRATTIYANESLKIEMDIEHPPEF
jgi:hypothetical protein